VRAAAASLLLLLSVTSAVTAQPQAAIPPKDAAAAQPRIPVPSKEFVGRVFSMTWQQWLRNLDAAVTSRAATRVRQSGMSSKTPQGEIVVTPRYSRGEARPTDLQVTIVMPPDQLHELTETTITEMMADARQALLPEYRTLTSSVHTDGDLVFYFTISER
jgi:hypothetical protein